MMPLLRWTATARDDMAETGQSLSTATGQIVLAARTARALLPPHRTAQSLVSMPEPTTAPARDHPAKPPHPLLREPPTPPARPGQLYATLPPQRSPSAPDPGSSPPWKPPPGSPPELPRNVRQPTPRTTRRARHHRFATTERRTSTDLDAPSLAHRTAKVPLLMSRCCTATPVPDDERKQQDTLVGFALRNLRVSPRELAEHQ